MPDSEVDRRAGAIWEHECFLPVVYDVEGRRLTRAEAYGAWVKQRWSRGAIIQYWNTLNPQQAAGAARRKPDSEWEGETNRVLRPKYGASGSEQRPPGR